MYSPFQLAFKYLRYCFTASNGKGHGIHSPFVFNLVTKVLNDKTAYKDYQLIEEERAKLLRNASVIEVEDFGAGSVKGFTRKRSIQQIASSSLKPKKYAQLLYRLVRYFDSKQVLELGTSLGITTSYLAVANDAAQVTTLEGSKAIAEVATSVFKELELQNINCVIGNFDDTLPLVSNKTFEFIFIDGNHRKEPTLRYFHQLLQSVQPSTVMVFDDIHWSRDMEEAWEEIKQHPSVTLTVDLFFIGLVFFRKEQKEKEHFVIRF
jgi:predicted O-methyltransferase YrrM